MLESLRIRNYRVFRDLKMDGLHRINLIAGKNNSGKTSLLEAIFLLAAGGNPRMLANTNVVRTTGLEAAANRQEFVQAWKLLFHKLDRKAPIDICAKDSIHGALSLRITSGAPPSDGTIPFTGVDGLGLSLIGDDSSLTLDYSGAGVENAISFVELTPAGVEYRQADFARPFEARILLERSGNPMEDAAHLALLRTQKQEHTLLKALQIIEPRLRSVEENTATGFPIIWGDIGLRELIPLAGMGEGMTRLTRIVLGMIDARGGILLMDEIDKGFHYTTQADVWKTIARVADEFDVQVFATTHSFESLQKAFRGLGDGFRFHRIDARDGMNKVASYQPDEIELAIELDFEVR